MIILMTKASYSNIRIARNSVFLTIRMFIVLVITLYTTRVLMKSLGIVDYGVYNVVCGFVSMFAFLNTSMTNGIQRFYNYALGKGGSTGLQDVYNTALKIQFILALTIVFLTESFGIWYLYNKIVVPEDRFFAAFWIFQFSIVSFLFVIMQAPFSASIMARERMDYFAFVGIIDACLKLAIALSLSLFSFDHLIVYGALLLAVSVLNFFLYYVYAKKSFPELKLAKVKEKGLFYSMLSFSGWNVFGSFSGMMKEQGINLILNLFFGPVVNAARGVSHQVNGGLKSLVFNLSTAIRPQVVQSYASGNVQRTMKLTYSISKMSCGVLYLTALPVILEINYILNVWLDRIVPEHTSTFVVIVILITFISCLNSAISGVVHASGKMAVYQVVSSLISLLCIPAAYFALRGGANPEAAYIWTFVFASLSHIAGLIILKTIVDYSIWDYCKSILFPLFFTIILTIGVPFIPHHFMHEGFLRLVVVVLSALVAIVPALFFVTFDRDERRMLLSLFDSFVGHFRKH